MSPTGATLRVIAMMEALTVTGPAKNLIGFARRLRTQPADATPRIDFSVILFERPGRPAQAFREALEKAGIRYHAIQEKRFGDPSVIPQLRAILKAEKPDIVQTHNSKSHVLIRCLGTSRGTRWVAFHHGVTATDWKDKVHNRIARWALRGAPRLITVCGAFAQQLEAAGVPASRISIRHNAITPVVRASAAETSALRASFGIPEDARVILAVGRLSAEKGHLDLIEAVGALHQQDPALRFGLLIAGEGPEREKIQRKAAALGIADRVILAGHQENVQPLYACAQVFVLPSHSEGSPNALLEAMSARLPIVATAVGGSTELVANEVTALVVPAHDPRALCSALQRLLTDDTLAARLGSGAESASLQYTPEAYERAVVGVYRESVGGRQMERSAL